MEKRIVQLRTHQKNISRYENMLKTELTDLERQFVQKRLSEERFTIALLQFTRTPKGTIWSIRIGCGAGRTLPAPCFD